MLIGEMIKLGWNGAKAMGDTDYAYEYVRVEAVGFDWVVLRSQSGKPLAGTFPGLGIAGQLRQELED